MHERLAYVYIMTNFSNTTLYTGATGKDLKQRIWEHKNKVVEGFTKQYNITKLVYYEIADNLETALLREKQIKGGSREKKIQLIEKLNKNWEDLYNNL